MEMIAALLLYGVLHAVLYSSLLPLWEGFDEAFHYGYVQELAVHSRFPVNNRATWTLGGKLDLPSGYRQAAVLLVLSTQMVYAAAAHVANDWLSIPLAPLLFLAALRFDERRDTRSASLLAITLSAGLLAKAYFLAFAPFTFGLVAWRNRRSLAVFAAIAGLCAGPWYLRNWMLYGNISGLQPSVASIDGGTLAGSFLAVPWPSALAAAARSSLWLANGSFSTFSATTLNLALLALGAGLVLWVRSALRRPPEAAEWIVIAGSAIYGAVLVYAIATFYVLSRHAATGATPWYSPALFPGLFCLALSGLARSGKVGRAILGLMLCLWTYIAGATYFAKLIPMYAGFGAQARPAALLDLYLHRRGPLFASLAFTTMIPPPAVVALAVLAAAAAVALSVRVFHASR